MSRTRWKTAAGLAVVAALLSGCGTTPGVAVAVGDHEISHDRVNEASRHVCEALGEQFKSRGTVIPMNFMRQSVVRLLALRSEAHQIAEAYGVEPGSTYANDVAMHRSSTASMPEHVREDYVLVNSTNALANDIAEQVGRIRLEEKGVEDPTPEEAHQAGVDVFKTWPDAHGLEVDPRYGLEKVDGELRSADTNYSVAVSDTAKQGLLPEPDISFVKSLPANHRCE